MQLILASSSVYRQELLRRLGLPFSALAPSLDETPLNGELPWETAQRLAREKALHIAQSHPDAIVIGSDQVAYLRQNDETFKRYGKPGTIEKAILQLQNMRGQSVFFHTAVCVKNTHHIQSTDVVTEVKFRDLNDEEIERYVHLEMPLDCAGSAKCEGLGITLLEYIRGDDPTALIGLPLIAVSNMLRKAGVPLP